MKRQRSWTFLVVALSGAIAIALGCSSTTATPAGANLPPSQWGSTEASLAITDTSATLLVLASGGCYGSYAVINSPIPNGPFSIAGTYTQLMGVYPGKVQYAAQFTGSVSGSHLSMTISVPALQRPIGPFDLTAGNMTTWPMCLYP